MHLSRLLVLCFALCFTGVLAAQEDCANGIDDDGDGLIDLNDTADCSCQLPSDVPSLLPNASLETFDAGQMGCQSVQPGGLPDAPNQANCLVGWQRASLGTTDAWNAFTLSGWPPFFPASLPQPLPSGTGIAGFWVGVRDSDDDTFTNGDGTEAAHYREYLAACLEGDNRMEQGQNYRLDFYLGFMDPQSFTSQDGDEVDIASPSPITLNIYGIRNCDQLYFGDFYDCPEASGAAGYELITSIQVAGQAGAWSPASVTFTAGGDYAAFAIGGGCGEDVGRDDADYFRNYYFIDNVILNRQEAFEQPVAGPVSVAGQTLCEDQITLTGQATAGATYQWYRDGIALVGETNRVLQLSPSPEIDGAYALRVSTAAGCAITEDVVIQRPVIADMIADTVALCPQLDTLFLRPSRPGNATFTWSDGSTQPYFLVTEPGDYSVTVSSVCDQEIETFTAVETDDITATVLVEPAVFCPGDTVAVSVVTDYYYESIIYETLMGEPLFSVFDQSVPIVVGDYDSLVVRIFHPCGQFVDTLDLTPDSTLFATAEIIDLSCEVEVGSIELSVPNPGQVEYAWADAQGNPIGTASPRLEVTTPGTYEVTIADGVRCPATLSYEVIYADSLELNLAVDSVQCALDGAARVTPSGGDAPFAVTWFRNDGTVPFASDTTAVGNLGSGNYRVVVTDATGCTRGENFYLPPPDTLIFSTATTFANCDNPDSGIITISPVGGRPPYSYFLNDSEAQTANQFTDLRAGTYTVAVRDSRGCDLITEEVTIAAPQSFTLSLPEERTIFLGDSTLLELQVSGIPAETGTAEWTPTDGLSFPNGQGATTVSARPARTTRYQATFTSSEGCSEATDILVVVNEAARLFIPNAFSPNNDQNNDELLVFPGPSVAEIVSFRVHDRWGSMLYEWNGEPGTGWDGTVGGDPVNPGVFFYLVEARLVNGSVRTFSGSVTLLR